MTKSWLYAFSIKIFLCLISNPGPGNCLNSYSVIAEIPVDNFDIKRPTIRAASNLNFTKATKKLRHAFEGYGTNENSIISILTSMDYHQRKIVEATYTKLFKKNLIQDVEKELSGSFRTLILALLQSPDKTLSENLNVAMKGWGTDEDCLTEILCCHNSDDITRIANEYKQNYKKVLETEVHSETSGKYRNILHLLLTRPRKSYPPNDGIANEIAQNFIRAGFGKSGKFVDSTLIEVLTLHSFPQLRLGMNKFREIIGSNLEDAVKKVYSGDFGQALLRIIECTQNRPRAYAKRLHGAMGRFRNDDKTLIRIVALRSSIDLDAIRSEYQTLYNEQLEQKVAKSTSGDLRTGLVALITGKPPQ